MSFWVAMGAAFFGLYMAFRDDDKPSKEENVSRDRAGHEVAARLEGDREEASDAGEADSEPSETTEEAPASSSAQNNPFRTRKIKVPPEGWKGGSMDDFIDGGAEGGYDEDDESEEDDEELEA